MSTVAVQRCLDAVAGLGTAIAILPAGTANLLATNLHVPADITGAVRVGLPGFRRELDTGSVNGEHVAVMAGAGFDARMIVDADRVMTDGAGRPAAKALRVEVHPRSVAVCVPA
jgi:diacylglycerol kinase (ATP)